MIKDLEGNEIQIIGESNGHKATYGLSGKGKTYFLVRELEEFLEKGRRVLILDFSGSYTEEQLKEKGFLQMEKIRRFTLYERTMQWIFQTNNADIIFKDVTDALCEALDCESYFQRKLLLEAVTRAMETLDYIRIADIVEVLEEMVTEETGKEKTVGNVENLQRLLTRLFPYVAIENFVFGNRIAENYSGKPITIIDMTNFPESQRKFLTKFVISLLWREVYRQEQRNRCDVLLLDEMQFLSLKEGSTLSNMLREGRKKDLDLILSTQYIGHYNRAELRAFQQAENMIIFRPAAEDCERSARMIDPENWKVWVPILSKLRRGEAVLKGAYRINSGQRILTTPIIIRIS